MAVTVSLPRWLVTCAAVLVLLAATTAILLHRPVIEGKIVEKGDVVWDPVNGQPGGTDCVLQLEYRNTSSRRDVRAFQGEFALFASSSWLSQLIDEPLCRFQIESWKPVAKNQTYKPNNLEMVRIRCPGQYERIRSTDLKDMRVSWKLTKVAYTDEDLSNWPPPPRTSIRK
jgi:hypothetical protein